MGAVISIGIYPGGGERIPANIQVSLERRGLLGIRIETDGGTLIVDAVSDDFAASPCADELIMSHAVLYADHVRVYGLCRITRTAGLPAPDYRTKDQVPCSPWKRAESLWTVAGDRPTRRSRVFVGIGYFRF